MGRKSSNIGTPLRILKPSKSEAGYWVVTLNRQTKYIHRLVLETFVGPCPVGMETRHLDGIKINNKYSNLKWDTPSNNNLDKRKHGTLPNIKGEKGPRAKLNAPQVRVIKWLLKNTDISQGKIGEIFNVHQVNISHINAGKTWSHI